MAAVGGDAARNLSIKESFRTAHLGSGAKNMKDPFPSVGSKVLHISLFMSSADVLLFVSLQPPTLKKQQSHKTLTHRKKSTLVTASNFMHVRKRDEKQLKKRE